MAIIVRFVAQCSSITHNLRRGKLSGPKLDTKLKTYLYLPTCDGLAMTISNGRVKMPRERLFGHDFALIFNRRV